jgi:hypothetical protein
MDSIKNTSKFQFGFKNKTSCIHALFAIRECVIPYIHDRKTQVYGVTIDAEKAFDSLWRDALFYKLLKSVPISIVKLLKNYYSLHFALIMNNTCIYPSYIKIINGVKQGGILSPFLFNYFINDLIVNISNLNLGLNFHNFLNLAISAFADDIFLLSFCLKSLQIMLNEVTNFGIEFNIKFNPDKTLLIVFSKYASINHIEINVFLNNSLIKIVDKLTLLGFKLNFN